MFSRPVAWTSTPDPWATTPIERRTRSGRAATSIPATAAVPSSACVSVVRIFTAVVFPGTVGTEQSEYGALLHGERQSVERLHILPVCLDEAVGLDRVRHSVHLRLRFLLSAGQLAAEAGLTSGAITAAIDRMERAGYVRRVADPEDRRRVLVEPTEKAYAVAGELMGSARRQGLAQDGRLHR